MSGQGFFVRRLATQTSTSFRFREDVLAIMQLC